jgi:hypothetical protein
MSLIIDIAGMIGGMLAEYASAKKWSKVKTFSITSSIFFTLSTINMLIIRPEKGIFVGILLSICLGFALGLFLTGLMYFHEKRKK